MSDNTYYGPGTDDLTFVPLTVEEEKALFATFYAGGDAGTTARDEIIKRHLKLVAKLSLQYAKRAVPEDEAISAGNVGLIQALEAKKFDANRGFRFASYVRAYIRGQVFTAMRERMGGVTVPTEDRDVRSCEAVVTGTNSGTYGNCGVNCHIEGTATTSAARRAEIETAVDHEYEETQLTEERRRVIEEALSTLKPMEQLSIRSVELEGKSHADVARENGCSRQASQQAHARGMLKLAEIFKGKRGELL